ncbi:MAG: hypothetical protein LBR54_04020 [Oscillospiraceae bacterium]|jgi:hypothetical protein|nr:hypothetical protein [Oscillospiraceae bacterium]
MYVFRMMIDYFNVTLGALFLAAGVYTALRGLICRAFGIRIIGTMLDFTAKSFYYAGKLERFFQNITAYYPTVVYFDETERITYNKRALNSIHERQANRIRMDGNEIVVYHIKAFKNRVFIENYGVDFIRAAVFVLIAGLLILIKIPKL